MLTTFFHFHNWPPPLLVPCTKMVYNTTSYLNKHICKQMSIILLFSLVVRLPGVPGSPRRTRRRLPGVPGSKKKKKKKKKFFFFFQNV